MVLEAEELRLEKNNSYYITNKKSFVPYAKMLETDKKVCFDFAYGMSYGKEGQHRDSRSGGIMHRTNGQIFINTFQGKMAEFALYRYLISKNIDIPKPDVSKFDLGIWDSYDLTCQSKKISIKSTKSYGNLLLLETKDWNTNGEYIPNSSGSCSKYDYTVLVRFKPDGEQIMKDNCLLNQRNNEISANIKDILMEIILKRDWEYDFAGFIYYSELVKMIRDGRILPQGALLNGKIKMDAENYYFQTGDMHNIKEIFTINSENDDHKDDKLIRRCPKCSKELVVKNGKNGLFWGCTGFWSDNCRYTESI